MALPPWPEEYQVEEGVMGSAEALALSGWGRFLGSLSEEDVWAPN